MALLDFIRNREASQQQSVAENSQQQKPQNAKEMYTQRDAQEKTAQKPVEKIPETDRAAAKAVAERIQKATQHMRESHPEQPGADSTGGREAMRQNMSNQDKAAPSLSPTSNQAGTTATKDAATRSNETRAKAPEKTPQRAQQTVQRRPPSWER